MRKLARRELGSRRAVKKCTRTSVRKSMLSLEMFLKENKIASPRFLYRTETSFRYLFNMSKQKPESKHLLLICDQNSQFLRL